MSKKALFDRPFFFTVLILVIGGFFIFSSASLGMFARHGGSTFSNAAFSQVLFGIIGGGIALLITSHIPYRLWKKYALALFIFSILLAFSVFIPSLGVSSGGATRWISLFGFTFQPAELLKFGYIIWYATWLSLYREKINQLLYGIVPFIGFLGLASLPLFFQPDFGTVMVISVAGGLMYLASGARFRDIALAGIIGVGSLALIASQKIYIYERIMTFLVPARDPLGHSYQLDQSLIAIGSGEWFGRGFGQSVQKFNFLPEPMGDSIFSVAAEEFGFIGAIIIISLFLFFLYRGLYIARHAKDFFGGLVVAGLVILIVWQSFVNMGAMLGILPLTGMPLIFVSHGGSALLLALAEVGIILNVSRHSRRKTQTL